MADSPRSALTRVLPWAALALMVVFFLLQVSARTKAERDASEARKALHDLEGARALAPDVRNFAGGDPESGLRFLRMQASIAKDARIEAEGEAERLAGERKALQARLERAGGVRAAHVAALEALRAERDSAEVTRSEAARIEAEMAPLEAEARARAGQLKAERDTAQGALAATELLRIEAEARVVELESLAAAISTQMDRLLAQAAENRERIQALTVAAARGSDVGATVRRWLMAATDRRSNASTTAAPSGAHALALSDVWMDLAQGQRKQHAAAFARVLTALPPSEAATGAALMWFDLGSHRSVEPAILRQLLRRHATGAHETTLLLAQRGEVVRAMVLERLASHAKLWEAHERDEVLGMLDALLRYPREDVRRDAARAFGLLQASEATPALIKALGDKESSVRHAAAWALTRMKRTAPAVSALKVVAKTLLASPKVADLREGLWVAQWVLGQPQNTAWLELSDGQVKRIAARVRKRLDG